MNAAAMNAAAMNAAAMNAAAMNNGVFDLSAFDLRAEVAVVIGGMALFQPADAMDLHSRTSARDAYIAWPI